MSIINNITFSTKTVELFNELKARIKGLFFTEQVSPFRLNQTDIFVNHVDTQEIDNTNLDVEYPYVVLLTVNTETDLVDWYQSFTESLLALGDFQFECNSSIEQLDENYIDLNAFNEETTHLEQPRSNQEGTGDQVDQSFDGVGDSGPEVETNQEA